MTERMAARLLLAASVAMWASSAATAKAEAGLPEPVRAMVEAAARSGDRARLDAVVATARETNPEAAAEIDAIVARIEADQASQREAALREAGFLDNWAGAGQIGASISTGNSRTRSLTAGLALGRDGLRWRHRADLLVDLVDNDGGEDQERIVAGYQLDYKFSERLYGWGRFDYERNREAGIRRRFAESAGLGWRAIAPGPVTWDLEVGPALRQTLFVDSRESRAAVRGASRFLWALSPATAFSNDTAFFRDRAASIQNTTALTTRLLGALSARLAVNLAWEEAPPPGLEKLDTSSRITLVYDF